LLSHSLKGNRSLVLAMRISPDVTTSLVDYLFYQLLPCFIGLGAVVVFVHNTRHTRGTPLTYVQRKIRLLLILQFILTWASMLTSPGPSFEPSPYSATTTREMIYPVLYTCLILNVVMTYILVTFVSSTWLPGRIWGLMAGILCSAGASFSVYAASYSATLGEWPWVMVTGGRVDRFLTRRGETIHRGSDFVTVLTLVQDCIRLFPASEKWGSED
jgi:hypothetical protein